MYLDLKAADGEKQCRFVHNAVMSNSGGSEADVKKWHDAGLWGTAKAASPFLSGMPIVDRGSRWPRRRVQSRLTTRCWCWVVEWLHPQRVKWPRDLVGGGRGDVVASAASIWYAPIIRALAPYLSVPTSAQTVNTLMLSIGFEISM